MIKEAQPWFAPTGENFDFASFILLKTTCFSFKNQVSQVLYFRELLETYDDKVIFKDLRNNLILRVHTSGKNSVKNSAMLNVETV